MISFRPVATRLLSKLRRPLPLEVLAVERREVAPSSDIVAQPVIELEDEPDRILKLAEGVGLDDYKRRMAGGLFEHPATTAYRLEHALIAGQTIYAGASYSALGSRSKYAVIRKPPHTSDRLLATNYMVEKYFGHWLTDGLSLELLAKNLGSVPIGVGREPWTQEPGYRAATGLELQRFEQVYVRDLWIVDDRAMNADRESRMAELRRRVRSTLRSCSGSPVFLLRKSGAKRFLVNQDKIAARLQREGFVVAVAEEESVEALLAKLANTRLVVSVEGSQLCHGVLAIQDGGTICAIQPPNRVNWIQKAWCDCAGLRLAHTVADPVEDCGFFMPEDRLLRLIEHIEQINPS